MTDIMEYEVTTLNRIWKTPEQRGIQVDIENKPAL